MKRLFIITLVVLMTLSFSGCDKTKIDTVTKGNAEEKIEYSEDQALFLASDRCDNDDDSHIVYSYNYKGDLIGQSDTYIGYYAENGLAVAYDQSTGMVGYVDKDGVYQIEPIYSDAYPFSKDGIALVEKQIENNDETYGYDEKVGYINSKGEEIIPCIYDSATSFFDCGYAIAYNNEDILDDNAQWIGSKEIYYIIDTNGEVVVKTDSEVIGAVFEDYYISSSGIYDYSGKLLSKEYAEHSDYVYYYTKKDGLYRLQVKVDEGNNHIESSTTEKFNGKEFVDIKESLDYNLYSKRVATTQSGYGYGVEVDGETVIPFEYDQISPCGDYFVAIKYSNTSINLDQNIDIYDKNYKKTAENIKYAFVDRSAYSYGRNCELPEGYFQIATENSNSGEHSSYDAAYGIIDYTGRIIIEPIYSDITIVNSYEGTGHFFGY